MNTMNLTTTTRTAKDWQRLLNRLEPLVRIGEHDSDQDLLASDPADIVETAMLGQTVLTCLGDPDDRNAQITADALAGRATQTALAAEHGLSTARVSTIVRNTAEKARRDGRLHGAL